MRIHEWHISEANSAFTTRGCSQDLTDANKGETKVRVIGC